MNGGDLLIEARGLALGYGRAPILRDVTWTVRRGECWFLLGPNGRGKSTLLKAILGQLPPASGSLVVHGSRDTIGFVPQRCDLNPAMPTTVREFASLGLVGLRVGRTEAEQRLAAALTQVNLAGRAGDSYWSLSGGQRQRVLLARALIRQPDLLILDEPTNGLDLPSEEALLGCLEALQKQRDLSVLFVTHDLALARRHASHVALFVDGSLRSGTCDERMTPEQLDATFGVEVGHV